MSIRDKASSAIMKERFTKKSEAKKSGKGGDKRFLNYFDLKEGEKMTIRLLPDGGNSGEYWLEYATHGGNLKLRGLDSISCAYTSSGENCPACAHSFDYHNDGDKEQAQRWRSKETHIGQCMVVDAPMEINETEDGNPIKLVYLPFSIVEEIQEAIMEGKIGEIMDHEFTIKKTIGKNGFAQYNKSYFNTTEDPLADDILKMFDDGKLNLFDLSEELPAPTSTEEVDEWLEKAIELDDKMSRRKSGRKSTKAEDHDGDRDGGGKEEEAPASKKVQGSSLMDRLKKKEKQ